MISHCIEQEAAHFDEIFALIKEAQSIAISAHVNPDGDALGSTLALAHLISCSDASKTVYPLIADTQAVPRSYRFLPGVEKLVYAADVPDLAPDLFISVDLSTPTRLGDAERILRQAKKVAVIDHHPAPEAFWDAGQVRTDAAATGVLIAKFAEHVGYELDSESAQCLFCALVTDTGRFQYQNADPEAFEVASKLVGAGADPALVALHVYQSDRLEYLHLAAKIMGRIVTFAEGKIAYSYATASDFQTTGCITSETEGLIDIVRCVEGTEFAVFLKELPDGKTRGNLRSKSDADVSGVARALGGGGHRAAAGFTYDGNIDQTLAKVLPLLMAVCEEQAHA